MNPSKAWNTKLEAATFLPSKNLYNQCEELKTEVNPNIYSSSGSELYFILKENKDILEAPA